MARRPYKGKNKLQKWEFLCAECQEWFMAKNTQVHHKIECGTLKNFNDIAGFTERLLCPAEDLMVLCKKCHQQKHHPKVK
jgi:5-methylcytosine-specific restriction endonuclease McrA